MGERRVCGDGSVDTGRMARILVTGAAGFIGSHLAEACLRRGDTVRGLDDFSTGRRGNLAGFAGEMELMEASLLDRDALQRACDGVEIVFHQAAIPSVPRSVRDPRTSHLANIDGTFNLLEAARAAGVRRVVYAGSSSAYGNQPGQPRVETMAPAPISPYAVQKLTGELYLQSYWQVFGMETVTLRYFNIFGPRQAADSPYSGVIAKWIVQRMRGERPVIFGDGEQGRDFTFVENAVSANLLAAETAAGRVAGRVFNVACGARHTLMAVDHVLRGLLGGPEAAHAPGRLGDVRDSEAEIDAARRAFGYEPRVDLREGLRRTVAWYRTQHTNP